MVVIARLLTLIVNDCDVAEAPVESVTWIVKLKLPCASGVPLIVTEFVALAPRFNPAGKVPEDTDHEKGPTPPLAFTVAL